MTTRLSPTQIHVLERMANGWELASSTAIRDLGAWLQEGKAGHGGKTETVSRATIYALGKRGLIVEHYSFPTSTYSLATATEKVGPT